MNMMARLEHWVAARDAHAATQLALDAYEAELHRLIAELQGRISPLRMGKRQALSAIHTAIANGTLSEKRVVDWLGLNRDDWASFSLSELLDVVSEIP